MVNNVNQKKNLSLISSEYGQADKLRQAISVIKEEQEKIANEITLLKSYLNRDVIWSVKLEQMRNLIPKEAWLTRFSYEKKAGKEQASLNLSGSLIPKQKENSIAVLSNFVNQLKEDKEFFSGFDNPVLSDVKTETKDGVEIMTFVIEIPVSSTKPR